MRAWVAELINDARHPNWTVVWVVGEDVTDVVVAGAVVVVPGTVVEVVAGPPVWVPRPQPVVSSAAIMRLADRAATRPEVIMRST